MNHAGAGKNTKTSTHTWREGEGDKVHNPNPNATSSTHEVVGGKHRDAVTQAGQPPGGAQSSHTIEGVGTQG